MIDPEFGWSKRPAHAAGIFPFIPPPRLLGLTSAKPRLTNLFDVAAWQLEDWFSFQFSISPLIRRGRSLLVGRGRPFRTLGEALSKAQRFDVVHVLEDVYVESVEVPSGVRIIANKGAILAHPERTPLRLLAGVKDVTISGLRIESRAPSQAAAVMVGVRNVELIDCEIASPGGHGVELHRASRVSLTGCDISAGIHGAPVFASYSVKLLDCRISAEHIGILAFHSAVRIETCEVVSAEAPAMVVIAPAQAWPEISVHADAAGVVGVQWVDFIHDFKLDLKQAFARNTVLPGMGGVFMSELRSSLAVATRFSGVHFAIAADSPGLVVLEQCTLVPDKVGTAASLKQPPPMPDLDYISYQDSHRVAQAYLGAMTVN